MHFFPKYRPRYFVSGILSSVKIPEPKYRSRYFGKKCKTVGIINSFKFRYFEGPVFSSISKCFAVARAECCTLVHLRRETPQRPPLVKSIAGPALVWSSQAASLQRSDDENTGRKVKYRRAGILTEESGILVQQEPVIWRQKQTAFPVFCRRYFSHSGILNPVIYAFPHMTN